MAKISEAKFAAYEKVRASGRTNMFDTTAVRRLSKNVLDRQDCIEIIKNYDELQEQYPNVRIA